MPLKRFGEPEPEPKPVPTPKETKSAFNPFKPVEDARKSVLGEKVYDDSETRMTPAEAKELIDALMKKAESGFTDAEKVIIAYGNAQSHPTDANVTRYTKALDELLADPEKTRAVLSILVAVTSNNYRKGR